MSTHVVAKHGERTAGKRRHRPSRKNGRKAYIGIDHGRGRCTA